MASPDSLETLQPVSVSDRPMYVCYYWYMLTENKYGTSVMCVYDRRRYLRAYLVERFPIENMAHFKLCNKF